MKKGLIHSFSQILDWKTEAEHNSEMRCLKIEDKWVNLILSGNKTWEIRRRNTRIRGRIALGNTKTKKIVGYAKIVDSVEMTVEKLEKHNDKHQTNDFLDEYTKGRKTLFAWVLDHVEVEAEPKQYSYSTGSWCRAKVCKPSLNIKCQNASPTRNNKVTLYWFIANFKKLTQHT